MEVTEPAVIWSAVIWAVLLAFILLILWLGVLSVGAGWVMRHDQLPAICPEGRITYQ